MPVAAIIAIFILYLTAGLILLGYIFHIIWCFSEAASAHIPLAIIGALLPVVGVIHGWML